MKGVIIYKSKYGSTRQYAEWICAETGFELFDVKQCPHNLSDPICPFFRGANCFIIQHIGNRAAHIGVLGVMTISIDSDVQNNRTGDTFFDSDFWITSFRASNGRGSVRWLSDTD